MAQEIVNPQITDAVTQTCPRDRVSEPILQEPVSPGDEYRLDITGLGIEEIITGAIEGDEKLMYSLMGDLTRYNPTAGYVDDSFSVDTVEFGENGEILIGFSYEWYANQGCDGLCKQGVVDDTITAKMIHGELVFDFPEFEKRSTFESF